MEELVPIFQYPREGGCQSQNVSTFLSGGGSVHTYFWLRDVGCNPTDRPPPGVFLPHGGENYVWDITTEMKNGVWEYPPLKGALQALGIETV